MSDRLAKASDDRRNGTHSSGTDDDRVLRALGSLIVYPQSGHLSTRSGTWKEKSAAEDQTTPSLPLSYAANKLDDFFGILSASHLFVL